MSSFLDDPIEKYMDYVCINFDKYLPLVHSGVKGMKWYTHIFGNWERHARYAHGMPNPETIRTAKYMFKAKDRMNEQHEFHSKQYDDMTFDPLPTPPIEKLKNLKRLDGSEDIKVVRNTINHPNDGTDGIPDVQRGFNCPNCALAFEMVERGYNVIARPKDYRSNVENIENFFKGGRLTPINPDDNPMDISGKYEAWQSATGKDKDRAKKEYWDTVNKAVEDTKNKTIEDILSQGEGARGIIIQGFMVDENPNDRTTAYHAFNYKVEDGAVRFYDVEGRRSEHQNGNAGIDEDAIDPRELYIMRTDNLRLSPSCTRGVYSNRGIKY